MDGIHTAIVNRHGKCFHLANGTAIEFSAMLDINRKITDEASAAVIAIYMLSDGRYKGVDLRLFRDTDGNEPTAYPDCDDLDCVAVNLDGKFFRLADDATLPFSAALDISLQPTNNADDIAIAIVQLPDGLYRGIDLRLFLEDHPDMIERTH